MSMLIDKLKFSLLHPLAGRLIWLIFAIVFFQSGLTIFEWWIDGLRPEGWLDWVLAALFPALVPLFFVVNARYGCVSGSCSISQDESGDDKNRFNYTRMPGA